MPKNNSTFQIIVLNIQKYQDWCTIHPTETTQHECGKRIPVALLFEPFPLIFPSKGTILKTITISTNWNATTGKCFQTLSQQSEITCKCHASTPGELCVQQSQCFQRNPPNCPNNLNKNEIMTEFYNWETIRLKEKMKKLYEAQLSVPVNHRITGWPGLEGTFKFLVSKKKIILISKYFAIVTFIIFLVTNDIRSKLICLDANVLILKSKALKNVWLICEWGQS